MPIERARSRSGYSSASRIDLRGAAGEHGAEQPVTFFGQPG